LGIPQGFRIGPNKPVLVFLELYGPNLAVPFGVGQDLNTKKAKCTWKKTRRKMRLEKKADNALETKFSKKTRRKMRKIH